MVVAAVELLLLFLLLVVLTDSEVGVFGMDDDMDPTTLLAG